MVKTPNFNGDGCSKFAVQGNRPPINIKSTAELTSIKKDLLVSFSFFRSTSQQQHPSLPLCCLSDKGIKAWEDKGSQKSNLPFQPPPDWLPWRCRPTVLAIPSSRSHTPSHAQDLHTISTLYDYCSIFKEECCIPCRSSWKNLESFEIAEASYPE